MYVYIYICIYIYVYRYMYNICIYRYVYIYIFTDMYIYRSISSSLGGRKNTLAQHFTAKARVVVVVEKTAGACTWK